MAAADNRPGSLSDYSSDRCADRTKARAAAAPGQQPRQEGQPRPSASRARHNPHERTDSARLAACRLLKSVLEDGAYANLEAIRLLDNQMLSAQDRAFVSALTYGTISRLVSIDWLLGRVLRQPLQDLEAWPRTVLRLGVWQLYWGRRIPAAAAVDESVRLARQLANPGAAALVNAVLRRLATPDSRPVLPANRPDLLYSLPPELYGYLKKWYGPAEATALAAAALADYPLTTIRVNPLQITPAELIAQLSAQGVTAEAGLYGPQALRLTLAGQSLRRLDSWQQGLFTVQDEAAMLVAAVVDPQPGERIADVCAAPGGKTTHLAELQGDQGHILAFDSHPGRLALVGEQAARLGLRSIECALADASHAGAPSPESALPGLPAELAGSFDRVLADVPCSGLGLLGHKPEIRLQMTHERMLGLYPLQAAILASAARLVRPGGILVYSTCTINPAENEEQVAAFLATAPDPADPADPGGRAFVREDLTPWLPAALLADPDLAVQARQGYVQILPSHHPVDGFYIARLRRLPGAGL